MRIVNGLATGAKWFLSLLLYVEPNLPPADRKVRNPIQRLRIIPIIIMILMAASILYLKLNMAH